MSARLDELFERHRDGATTPTEIAELTALLDDPAMRRVWRQLMTFDGALREALAPVAWTPPRMAPTRPVVWAWSLGAGLAAVAAVIAVALLLRHDAAALRIVEVGADATIVDRAGDRHPAVNGAALGDDESAHGPLTLVASDGSRFALDAGAEARRDIAATLRLTHGRCVVAAEPRDPSTPLTVSTPHLVVSVIGTRFTVTAGDERSLVAVEHGRVRVATPVATTEVGAGEVVAASPGVAPHPVTQAATRWRLDLRTPVHRAGDGWVGGDASDGATLVHHHDSDDGTVPIHLLWTAVVPAPGLARVTDDLRFVAHLSLAREHAILVQLQLGDPADHQRWFANIQAEVAVGAGREQRIVVPWSAFARVAGPGPVLDTSIYRVLILTGGDPGELVVHDLSLERP